MKFLHIEPIGTISLLLMIAGICLCLLSYILRLAAHVNTYRGGKDVLGFRARLVLTFFGYLGWGYGCGADPVKMNLPSSIALTAGIGLTVLGFALFLYAETAKHGFGDTDQIYTRGIYARVRHPMYIGLILLHIGFPLIFRSFLLLLSTLLWAALIAIWTHYEEKNLERRFGQRYIDYKRQTWF